MQTNTKSAIARKYRDRGVGIGGWHCACCAPPKSHRKAYLRLVRRNMKRDMDKIDFADQGED